TEYSGDLVQDPDFTARGEWRIATPGQAEGGRTWTDAGRRSGTPTADPAGVGSGEHVEPRIAGIPATTGTSSAGAIDWGSYAPAIARWEAVRGAAPAPTELTAKGKHRLSARFAEWISRNEALKIIGNGVVPQQAAAALRDMLAMEGTQ